MSSVDLAQTRAAGTEEAAAERRRALREALRLDREGKHDDRLVALTEIGRTLSAARDLDECLALIVELTSDIFDAERSSIFLYDPAKNELVVKVAEGLDRSSEIRFPATKGLAGYVAKTGQLLNIPDAYKDRRFNPAADQKFGFRTTSVLAAPLLNHRNDIIGVLQVLNKRDGQPFPKEDEHLIAGVAGQCAVAIENARLLEEIDNLFEVFIETASQAIEQRDPTTAGHSRRVTLYSLKLAKAVHNSNWPDFKDFRYTRERLRQLRYAGLLHDFGKIGVREAVLCKVNKLLEGDFATMRERVRRVAAERTTEFLLNQLRAGVTDITQIEARLAEFATACEDCLKFLEAKNQSGWINDEDLERLRVLHNEGIVTDQELTCLAVRRGNLTPPEWDDIRSHVSKTFLILKDIPWPQDLKEIPRIAHAHHEKLDGSGYPLGISRPDIHFDSQIMTIADIYDALTASDRSYKKAMDHENAMRILRDEAQEGKLNWSLVELFDAERCYMADEEDSQIKIEKKEA